jgi:hypothetical protein
MNPPKRSRCRSADDASENARRQRFSFRFSILIAADVEITRSRFLRATASSTGACERYTRRRISRLLPLDGASSRSSPKREKTMPTRRFVSRLAAVVCLLVSVSPASAYSVLTHEAIIDTAWEDSLRPALLARYPNATDEDLRKAHAHAYGGVIVQDMGYYPFGTKLFSDLTHYVRSGEFIETLVAGAQNLNEYAFALGAIAHYAGDTNGHSIATNPSVALIYPKLRKKYGDVVTYAEDDKSHIRTEFGFDVLQVARGRYASQAYHDFIGFEVSENLLERTFLKTYGLELGDVLDHADLAIESFRYSVSELVPSATEMAWEIKKDEIEKENAGIVREKFVYSMDRTSYEKQWGDRYVHAGPGTKILSFFVGLMPKVGPFRAHGFKPPTPESEKLYLESIDRTVVMYRALIADARRGRLELDNRNFDTGEPLRLGEYVLADKAYEKWLRKLEKEKFATVTPEIRSDILAYYEMEAPAVAARDHAKGNDDEESRKSIRDAREILRRLTSSTAGAERMVSAN